MVTRPDAGEVYEFEGEGVGDDLKALRGNLRGRYEWIWGKRLEEDLAEAMKVMRGG